ncbi:hypothetical protein QUB80_33720 [Chlorogloeopsis sp. ULAP01]|uniref:hypothetical protein n=1 Tax=Chlorogloeopsis sp. ULAP01 TaxID=3056483 RepID=UPI0025AA3755|nr:hypothetical protein [Chlorogloeopsis sp. ULAP01]MDM9385617.1 hypothetical protein [Chlorogloeopsis sp. ULAP01]
MNPKESDNPNTPRATEHGNGELTPDAGSDTSRADYSNVGTSAIQYPELNESGKQPDLNDSLHESNNVDVPILDPSIGDQQENVVEHQMGIIGHTAG